MYLERKHNKAVGRSHVVFKDIRRYIGMLIDVYAATSVKRENWLSKTERAFYIATIIHVNAGYTNPICDESVQIYKEFFNEKVTKVKISDYINRVRNRKWVKYEKDDKVVEIPEIFKNINLTSDIYDFNLRFSYERTE